MTTPSKVAGASSSCGSGQAPRPSEQELEAPATPKQRWARWWGEIRAEAYLAWMLGLLLVAAMLLPFEWMTPLPSFTTGGPAPTMTTGFSVPGYQFFYGELESLGIHAALSFEAIKGGSDWTVRLAILQESLPLVLRSGLFISACFAGVFIGLILVRRLFWRRIEWLTCAVLFSLAFLEYLPGISFSLFVWENHPRYWDVVQNINPPQIGHYLWSAAMLLGALGGFWFGLAHWMLASGKPASPKPSTRSLTKT